jgi:hypothetical protein
MGGACSTHGYTISFGKSEGKRPLGRSGCRWEDNIKMDFAEIVMEVVDWILQAQDRATGGVL